MFSPTPQSALSNASDGSDLGRHRAVRASIVFILLSVTVLQRFGVNLGSYSLNMAIIAMYVAIATALLAGSLQLSRERLILVFAGLAVAMLSLLANNASPKASASSMMLLILMYLPYTCVLRKGSLGPVEATWSLRVFSDIALFCAYFGIVQFYAQFVIHAPWLFDFSPYIPSFLQGPDGYNTVIEVGSRHKSNGFFFREPSAASFIVALALLVELALYKRVWRLICFALALLVTYSGTGLLTLAIGLLLMLRAHSITRAMGFVALGAAAFVLLRGPLDLDFTVGRLAEFKSPHSSAYIRYMAPMRLIGDTFNTEAWTLWLGHGPGSISREVQRYEFHDPTWSKLIFEYGIAGLASFIALTVVSLRRSAAPFAVRATLWFSWLVMGGHLLSPESNYLTLALVTFMPDQFAQARTPRGRPREETRVPSAVHLGETS